MIKMKAPKLSDDVGFDIYYVDISMKSRTIYIKAKLTKAVESWLQSNLEH